MANTGTPTPLGGGTGPAMGLAKGQLVFIPATLTAGATYATGGNPITLPAAAKGMKLRQFILTRDIPAAATDRIYFWDGSATAPKLVAKVISTAAEVANAVDTSADTLAGIFVFET